MALVEDAINLSSSGLSFDSKIPQSRKIVSESTECGFLEPVFWMTGK